jgi:flagellar basal-body rod protein FlgG
MKIRYIVLLLPAVLFLPACQKTRSVSIPAPEAQSQSAGPQLSAQSLDAVVKEQKQMKSEIDKLVKAMSNSKDEHQKLFDRMAIEMDRADVLLTVDEAINMAIDVTLNNIANCDTTGFKKQRFHIQDGTLVKAPRVWRQGVFRKTDSPLDLVIEGEGFFQVLQPNGERVYTRDGNLHLNRKGYIVTVNGDMLGSPIAVPSDQVGIFFGKDGTVLVEIAGQSQLQIVGQIELARFQNPSGLKSIAGNLFVETPDSGDPIYSAPGENGSGTLLQGFLEASNVNMMEELMQLRMLQSWEKGVEQALLSIHGR